MRWQLRYEVQLLLPPAPFSGVPSRRPLSHIVTVRESPHSPSDRVARTQYDSAVTSAAGLSHATPTLWHFAGIAEAAWARMQG